MLEAEALAERFSMKNIIIALSLTLLAAISSRHLFDYDPHSFVIIGIYLLLYGIVAWIHSLGKKDAASSEVLPDKSNWPLPGPFKNLGENVGTLLFLIIFWVTNLLSLLNPFQLSQIIRQLIGNGRLKRREKQSGNNGADYQTKENYSLPFRGEWLVYNGGITPKRSHSWDILGQRFALDFVIADENFSRHSGKGTQLNDYYCYGKEVLAASDGTVISLENNISDAPFVGFGFCDFTARNFIGNHVIIHHEEKEYGLYAHLIKGSVSVRPGEKVKQGQVIGLCGHSGHSSEPHLHFHLQDSPDIFNGMGLPVKFSMVEIDNKSSTDCYVKVGQRVRNIDSQDRNAPKI